MIHTIHQVSNAFALSDESGRVTASAPTRRKLLELLAPKLQIREGNGQIYTVKELLAGGPQPDIIEQHQYLSPDHIDYLSLKVANKSEKTFSLTAILNEEGEKLHRQRELEARTTDFSYAKEAREWAKRHYPRITVQRD